MMAIKTSLYHLRELSQYLTNFDKEFKEQYDNFLKNTKSDYYWYGREPVDTSYITFSIIQLEQILAAISHTDKRYSTLHSTINTIYQAGKTTAQKSAYLYGRTS